ncbi:hypothetical protein G6F37_005254 [Rhizopus arrhizus]|nr:hypothetical protein G6F38_002196 [Rhizopus arrhizus]KAG1159043.1 hypothetical protein G6F37_005254 [Rhizopus arrhizus]
MMCDTNWCTFCDNAISPYSDSLYCSESCLRHDALLHHPMLGYDYAELQGFPHVGNSEIAKRRRSSTHFSLPNHKLPSLSSSFSSTFSDEPFTTIIYQPKPRHVSSTDFMEQT